MHLFQHVVVTRPNTFRPIQHEAMMTVGRERRDA
jgi:hypothetical protein